MICCCCRKRSFAHYAEVVDLGTQNFTADMDLVRFLRRARMHGFGLHFLLDEKFRSLSARLAFSRPLMEVEVIETLLNDPTDINTIRDKWYHIENLKTSDRFLLALFKKYASAFHTIMEKKPAASNFMSTKLISDLAIRKETTSAETHGEKKGPTPVIHYEMPEKEPTTAVHEEVYKPDT